MVGCPHKQWSDKQGQLRAYQGTSSARMSETDKVVPARLEFDWLAVGQLEWQHRTWTHWDLNPGPSACEADVMPLHHVPLVECPKIKSLSTTMMSGADKVDMQSDL